MSNAAVRNGWLRVPDHKHMGVSTKLSESNNYCWGSASSVAVGGHGVKWRSRHPDFEKHEATRFEYRDLAIATDHFSEEKKLGEGYFGVVYRGNLKREVAVKMILDRSNVMLRSTDKDFYAELNTVTLVNHENLVKLVGETAGTLLSSCVGVGTMKTTIKIFLVYELVPKGSLHDHLHKVETLPWETRYQIVKGITCALVYLHHECDPLILHRDIKPSNILLDNKFDVKLADFGLSRIVDPDSSWVLTLPIGTVGYLDPQCMKSVGMVEFSRSSDVYSYGIVLLEIACRKGKKFGNYINRSLMQAADDKLNGEFCRSEMENVIILGLWCSFPDSKKRPSMLQVMAVLEHGKPLPDLDLLDRTSVPTQLETYIDPPAHTKTNSAAPPPPFSFSFDDFTNQSTCCSPDLQFEGNATVTGNLVDLTCNQRDGNINYCAGRMSYKRPVPFYDDTALASFNTTFTFAIKADNNMPLGDGLAFFLSAPSDDMPPNSNGSRFGLLSSSQPAAYGARQFVAVEFDTYTNPSWSDPINNHIGIDINTLIVSFNTTSFPNMTTLNGTWTATITFDNITSMLSASLRSHDNSSMEPLVVTQVLSDPRAILPREVEVGFSAATGANKELNQILSWSFNSTIAAPLSTPHKVPALVILVLVAWFSEGRRLGEGFFGVVHRGYLKELGHEVAIKEIKPEAALGLITNSNTFSAELDAITSVKHKNLVKLFGWCRGNSSNFVFMCCSWKNENDRLFLVYELMPKGSLHDYLHKQAQTLPWETRYKIVKDITSALHYLHHEDIKPRNILLDDNFNAKLADFGLSRIADPGHSRIMTVPVGSERYLDPECKIPEGKVEFSRSSDIYSYGIVLLEIACGKQGMATINSAAALPPISFSFDFTNQSSYDSADLRFEGNATVRRNLIDLSCNSRGQNIDYCVGRVSYYQPVPLYDDTTLASFSTSFTFMISVDNNTTLADGIAFFLTGYPSSLPPNSTGGNLGFLSSNERAAYGAGQFVAVEFDTYHNVWDPPDNHIGIDVNTLISLNTTSLPQGRSLSGTWTATIRFDITTTMLSASLRSNDNSSMEPVVVTQVLPDPRAILPREAAVGLSASTGFSKEINQILAWSFNSTIAAPSPPHKGQKATIIVGGVLALLLLVVVAWFVLSCWKWRSRHPDFEKHKATRFEYRDLAVATDHFSEEKKLGEGYFGVVYRGNLKKLGREVAVKMILDRSNVMLGPTDKDFYAELNTVTLVNHENLVKLVGWCRGNRWNFFEFMCWCWNYENNNKMFLVYELPSRSPAQGGNTAMGTEGYLDPECKKPEGKVEFSRSTDIYSYGIVLLEIACRKGMTREKVWQQYLNRSLMQASDDKLKGEFRRSEMENVIILGLWCSFPDSKKRPSMLQVMAVLEHGKPPPDLDLLDRTSVPTQQETYIDPPAPNSAGSSSYEQHA
ncbi:hypothetical protein U9M48_001651 [Paspalum notatum var. saurae]|uniref:non-specific serine/threonine protein kinase n=1 Tax=Paspalum notatum var. saurae TaxID=547442 RepID=A0AAQ3PIL9_PASNO